MTVWLFPDNTVLCNFAAVGRVDLLHTYLGERGRWTEAIEAEARKSANFLPGLAQILDGGWMGPPIEITDDEDIRRIDVIRRDVFGGRSSDPLKHLGEAQTCFLIHRVPKWKGSTWISDEGDALEFARFQNIPAMETIDVMGHLVADYEISTADAMALMRAMDGADRAVRLPRTISDLGG